MKLMPNLAQSPEFIVQRKITTNFLGFTMVELLVVITIIGILSAVSFGVYGGVQRNARDTKRKTDIENISKALEGSYNPNSGTPYGPLTGGMFDGGSVPQDPKNFGAFTYSFNGVNASAQVSYVVCAHLEAEAGGNASDATGGGTSGAFYCAKNKQ